MNQISKSKIFIRQLLRPPLKAGYVMFNDDSRKEEILPISKFYQSAKISSSTRRINLAEILVNRSSSKIQPYLKLMRFDKPTGSWLLFWPCGWGIALAADPGCLPDFKMLAIFGAGALVMRGAGCTINDMWDKDIDAKVERTKSRPLVSGAITLKEAWVFLAGQLSVALTILLQLNWYSVFLGASSMILVISYPLMKRITHWPQLVLGMTFNWGALLGYSAIHSTVDWSICLPLYTAGVCWTILYDTIYAHQDVKDDILLGIKSTAIKFGEHSIYWLSGFGGTMLASLCTCGILSDQTWPFFTAVGLAGVHVGYQLSTLNVKNPLDCNSKFMSNKNIGLLIFTGIVASTLLKREKKPTESDKTSPTSSSSL